MPDPNDPTFPHPVDPLAAGDSERQPNPTGPGTPNPDPNEGKGDETPQPNAQVEGSDLGSGGPIPGMATTYGRDAAAIERERLEHIRRAGHRADVAGPPEPAPDPEPIRELPVEYLTPEGYAVAKDILETYHLHKGGHPRATGDQMLERVQKGMEAFENQPFAENPLGDAPLEG